MIGLLVVSRQPASDEGALASCWGYNHHDSSCVKWFGLCARPFSPYPVSKVTPGADFASGTMPVVYNLRQHGAPSSSSPSSSTWIRLSPPWLCGAVLVIAVLLFRHRRGKFSTTATAPSQLPTLPRRRSYTKTSTVPISPARAYTADELEFGSRADPNPPLVMGIELTEEVIIAAEGWRRHTRVYGGGACRACEGCEESEEQMRLMGVRPVEMENKDEHKQVMKEKIAVLDDKLGWW